MNMARQVTTVFLEEARSGSGKVSYTAQLYPNPSDHGVWEGFYTGFVIGEYKGGGSINHLGYIKWSDGTGWGRLRVKPGSHWRATGV